MTVDNESNSASKECSNADPDNTRQNPNSKDTRRDCGGDDSKMTPPQIPPESSKSSTRDYWLLFVFLHLVFALTASGILRITDEVEVFYQTQSLVERHSLAIPQAVKNKHFFGRHGLDGKAYAPYGPATAFFAIPHYLAGRLLVKIAGHRVDSPPAQAILAFATGLASGTYIALTLVLFALILECLGLPRAKSLVSALILGFCSVLWTYGTCFYGESITCFLITLTLWAWIRSHQLRFALLGLVSFSLAILCKAPLMIYAPGLMLWGLAPFSKRRRGRVQFIVALVLAVGLSGWGHMWWNLARYADPFQFGYDWSETITGRPQAFGNSFWRGLVALTVSPGKGLFVFVPCSF